MLSQTEAQAFSDEINLPLPEENMDLMEKFSAVQVKKDDCISETDRWYCEQHQQAYETAVNNFKELAFFWADMKQAQKNILGQKDSSFFHDYLSSREGPSISQREIKRHIESLHIDFIMNLTHYFNSAYHVSVDSSAVSTALLPEKPQERWRSGYEEKEKSYHEQMQSLMIQYQDVVEQIILRLDGRSFAEQAFFELYNECHQAAWNSYDQTPRFMRKKDTIQFSGYFCKFDGFPYDAWQLEDKMKKILYGAAHYETGTYHVYPLGFSGLLGYGHVDDNEILFETCSKICRLKMFKNNRVDLKFSSADYAEEFISKYLGTVY